MKGIRGGPETILVSRRVQACGHLSSGVEARVGVAEEGGRPRATRSQVVHECRRADGVPGFIVYDRSSKPRQPATEEAAAGGGGAPQEDGVARRR